MSRRAQLLLAVAALAGLVEVVLTVSIAHSRGIHREDWALFWPVAGSWAAFAVGAFCLLRAPRRAAVVLCVALAVVLRVAAVSGSPKLSDDLYRYAWDGRVQAHGIDPYRYAPIAPELRRLRDAWLWPGARECAARNKPPRCSRINRRRERTIYPPVAEAWFTGVGAVAGTATRSTAWQIVAALADLALLAVLLALLRRWGRDPRWIVLYAWSPLVVLEVAQNGHVDGLAALLAVGAIAALAARPALAGALLAGATLVKLYPAVLLPLLVARRAPRALAVFAGVCALAYLPHVLAVGTKVIGYLGGYLQEEHYDSGGRFQLLGLLGLPAGATKALAIAILAAVAVLVVRRRPAPEVGAAWILGTLFLVATPVQPWYAVTLAAVAALSGAWWWSALCLAGQILYWQTLSGGWDGLGPVAYALSLALVLGVLLNRTSQTRPETRNAAAVSAAQ